MTISQKEKALGKATFDFLETLGHINLLVKQGTFGPSAHAEETLKWQAFSIATLICYSRPFLKSYCLDSFKTELLSSLSSDEKRASHEKFIDRRNKLLAHSDGDKFEIQIRNASRGAMSLHSDDKYLNRDEAEELRLLTSELLSAVTALRHTSV